MCVVFSFGGEGGINGDVLFLGGSGVGWGHLGILHYIIIHAMCVCVCVGGGGGINGGMLAQLGVVWGGDI